jgi:hypothetical protein
MNRDEILKLAERAELVSLRTTKSAAHNAVEEIIQKQCLHFAELLLEAHTETQNHLLETTQQELALLLIELTQEKS